LVSICVTDWSTSTWNWIWDFNLRSLTSQPIALTTRPRIIPGEDLTDLRELDDDDDQVVVECFRASIMSLVKCDVCCSTLVVRVVNSRCGLSSMSVTSIASLFAPCTHARATRVVWRVMAAREKSATPTVLGRRLATRLVYFGARRHLASGFKGPQSLPVTLHVTGCFP
jgi:hypothetical protein